MNRVTWFAAGAVAGAYSLVKVRRTARNFTPDGVAARAAALGAGARVLVTEVSAGMAERETELRHQLDEQPRDPVARIEQTSRPRHRAEQSRMEPDTDGHR